jgi:hypothetical protein
LSLPPSYDIATDIAALSIERNKNVVVGLSGFATNEASILLILRPSDEGLWVGAPGEGFFYYNLACNIFLCFYYPLSVVGCWC